LERLPVPADLWLIIIVPNVRIPTMTASVYARLSSVDFSDGSRIAAQAAILKSNLSVDVTLLENTFIRPLYDVVPELAGLAGIMREAGSESVAISGAGPAHYVVLTDLNQAERIARSLHERLGDGANVFVARPVAARV
jgi:4-diphosphocytidyl-2C-methyl-D-erythritol kinase